MQGFAGVVRKKPDFRPFDMFEISSMGFKHALTLAASVWLLRPGNILPLHLRRLW